MTTPTDFRTPLASILDLQSYRFAFLEQFRLAYFLLHYFRFNRQLQHH